MKNSNYRLKYVITQKEYDAMKEAELERLIDVLNKGMRGLLVDNTPSIFRGSVFLHYPVDETDELFVKKEFERFGIKAEREVDVIIEA